VSAKIEECGWAAYDTGAQEHGLVGELVDDVKVKFVALVSYDEGSRGLPVNKDGPACRSVLDSEVRDGDLLPGETVGGNVAVRQRQVRCKTASKLRGIQREQ
jgi:hypothetical protein